MANAIIHNHDATGETLYFQVINDDGEVWNTSGTAFETYAAGNWSNYDIALTEQGASRRYVGTFPDPAAGAYSVSIFRQAGGSPAEGDPIVSGFDLSYDGSQIITPYVIHAALTAIRAVTDNIPDSGAMDDLATILEDTNELQTDLTNGGRIDLLIDAILADTNELQTDWVNGGRLDLLIDAILADTNELQTDWVNGGRLDLLIDAILADTNELQTDWVNGGRLDLLIDAILADTNELQTDWVNGGRLDLLVDAILADTNELQTDWVNGGRLDLLIDAILEDTATTLPAAIPSAASVAAAVLAAECESNLTVALALSHTRAWAAGKVVRTGTNPLVYDFYNYDQDTPLFELTIPLTGGSRASA